MDFLYAVFVDPFVQMADSPIFFAEVVIGGLTTGVMYSLVALGFVLIFKASGVFNFAQGVLALFAALTLVGVLESELPLWIPTTVFAVAVLLILALVVLNFAPWDYPKRFLRRFPNLVRVRTAVYICVGALAALLLWKFKLPVWLAIPVTAGVMVLLAMAIERLVLRPLVNQEQIILFMSTLGLALFLEGFGDVVWGSDVKRLDIGIPDESFEWGGILLNQFDMVAAATAAVLVIVLAVFFQKTRVGRALRAVADDHQAALSVGIPLKTIWVIVWSVSGLVALVAGIMWGAKSGVQFSLSLIALKALPVLILGGFTSVPGAIVGGLIIGVGEKVAELYWADAIGGAIENWFAYMLALVFLMFRPQGLFGEKIIERV